MNPEQLESSPSQASALQTLSLSNIKDGMRCNVESTQELQQEFAPQKASLQKESAEAQTPQGKEALLVDIIEEKIIHLTQVLVLSQLHLWQAKGLSLNLMR